MWEKKSWAGVNPSTADSHLTENRMGPTTLVLPLSLLFMNSNSCCLNCKGGRRRKGYKGKKGRRRVLCERGNFSTREGFFPLCHFTFGRVVPQRQLLLQGTRLNLRSDLKEENLFFFVLRGYFSFLLCGKVTNHFLGRKAIQYLIQLMEKPTEAERQVANPSP